MAPATWRSRSKTRLAARRRSKAENARMSGNVVREDQTRMPHARRADSAQKRKRANGCFFERLPTVCDRVAHAVLFGSFRLHSYESFTGDVAKICPRCRFLEMGSLSDEPEACRMTWGALGRGSDDLSGEF